MHTDSCDDFFGGDEDRSDTLSDKAALVNPVTWAKLKAVLFYPPYSAIFGASGLSGVH